MAEKTLEQLRREHEASMKQARAALRTVNRLLLPYQKQAWIDGTIAHLKSGGLAPKPEVPDAWKPEKLTASERAAAAAERDREIDALLEEATRKRPPV